MSTVTDDLALDPDYVAGLLDTTARVRFNFSEQPDGTFTVRPQLRIKFFSTEMRAAVIGTFLDERDYAYEFVDRERGHDFFLLQQRSDLRDLHDYLGGHSTTLVRELEYVTGSEFERYDTEILGPQEAYRFLLTRDELRYGWRPRAPNLRDAESISDEYDVDVDATPSALPDADLSPNESLKYVAGIFDGRCRYRPSIAESSEASIGYSLYPVARLSRGGVNSALIESVRQFCRRYDLQYGNGSGEYTLMVVFTGPNAIRRVLDVVFPHLLVLADPSVALLDEILPRFDAGHHRNRQGFYELVRDFDTVASATGGPYRGRDYDPEYFAREWDGEIDTEQTQQPESEVSSERSHDVKYPESVTVSSEDFEDDLERFHSVVDRRARDQDLVTGLKRMYNDRCQVCGTRRAKPDGTGYSEVHHLEPLEVGGDEADTLENMVVVCPNHHADFDNGVIRIDVETLTVEHPYEPDVDGKPLTVEQGDAVSETYLRYHNEVVANVRGGDRRPSEQADVDGFSDNIDRPK